MPDSVSVSRGVVSTIATKCRRCYHCVRGCPAKAIRVQGGQAHVMADRCIGCGNCVRVCAQQAKEVESAVQPVWDLLAGGAPVVAILAPTYPAAFEEVSAGQVVSAVRALGFQSVLEVGFGAEMVAAEYARLLQSPPDHPLISTPCPALVSYVEKYMPKLRPCLVPVVSPMIALGRAVKQHRGDATKVVFIGPCIAKKAELAEPGLAGAVDAALTFAELAELLSLDDIVASGLPDSAADEPLPHYGALFPVPGGLLKTAAVEADISDDSVLVVDGPDRCLAALQELAEGKFSAKFVDALLCEGCLGGPVYGADLSAFARREKVTAHLRSLPQTAAKLAEALESFADVSLARTFRAQALSAPQPNEREIRDILAQTNKLGPADEQNCGACGYATCRDKAIAVYQGLAEPEMCLPYLIDQLQVNLEKLIRSKDEIERARELASRAQQLAAMGQLASDIAHEISNPLSNITVFAQLLRDNMPEDDVRRQDVATIVAEALHCREVLSGLQSFARQREPQWQECRLADVVARALGEVGPRLAFSDIEIKSDVPADLPRLFADPAQLSAVLVNLVTNSIEALGETGSISLTAQATPDGQSVELVVADDGPGISPELLPRVCQPFITTKATRGAGMGLAVAHGVIQTHGGGLQIASKPGQGTEVTVRLPLDVAPAPAPEAAKVLVVDDDPDFLEQHRIVLSGMGFDVVTAERSDEALEVSDREVPDAFVLDMMMERADSGARLARALRRDPRFRKAPIIMLTSVVQATGFEFARNPKEVLEWMKADAWFDKPAPVAELANTIRRLLESRPGGADVAAPAGAEVTATAEVAAPEPDAAG